jgi:hypothetical protein
VYGQWKNSPRIDYPKTWGPVGKSAGEPCLNTPLGYASPFSTILVGRRYWTGLGTIGGQQPDHLRHRAKNRAIGLDSGEVVLYCPLRAQPPNVAQGRVLLSHAAPRGGATPQAKHHAGKRNKRVERLLFPAAQRCKDLGDSFRYKLATGEHAGANDIRKPEKGNLLKTQYFPALSPKFKGCREIFPQA